MIKRKLSKIDKINIKGKNALIFKQNLTTNFSRKCMEISLENSYADIGSKG